MGHDVATAHLRYLNPFPKNLHDVLNRYRTIAVPEINTGQLVMLLRSQFLIDAIGINEIQGRAFRVNDLVSRVEALIKQ